MIAFRRNDSMRGYPLVLRAFALCMLFCAATGLAGEPPAYLDHRQLLVVRDKTGGLQPITRAEQWAKRREHILQSMQAVMGELPPRGQLPPLDVQISEDVDMGGVRRLRLTFASEVVMRGGQPVI